MAFQCGESRSDFAYNATRQLQISAATIDQRTAVALANVDKTAEHIRMGVSFYEILKLAVDGRRSIPKDGRGAQPAKIRRIDRRVSPWYFRTFKG